MLLALAVLTRTIVVDHGRIIYDDPSGTLKANAEMLARTIVAPKQ